MCRDFCCSALPPSTGLLAFAVASSYARVVRRSYHGPHSLTKGRLYTGTSMKPSKQAKSRHSMAYSARIWRWRQ
ncbi:hypothetical protein BJX68DRAFT_240512 [Aspergillus pseudodeflectus]|uniref:Secreted protein n=1 Tax=Aspergillus pseudodeflectus TaxID=176178 RepID=A0ABR4K3Z8_9EURO